MLLLAPIDSKPYSNANKISTGIDRSVIGRSAHIREQKLGDQYLPIEGCYLQTFFDTI